VLLAVLIFDFHLSSSRKLPQTARSTRYFYPQKVTHG